MMVLSSIGASAVRYLFLSLKLTATSQANSNQKNDLWGCFPFLSTAIYSHFMTNTSEFEGLIKDNAPSVAALQHISKILADSGTYREYDEMLDHSLYSVVHEVQEFETKVIDNVLLVHMEMKRCLHKVLVEKELADPMWFLDDIQHELNDIYLSSLRILMDYLHMSGFSDNESAERRTVTYKRFKNLELLCKTMHSVYIATYRPSREADVISLKAAQS